MNIRISTYIRLLYFKIYNILILFFSNLDSSMNSSDVLMGLIPMFHGYGFLLNCLSISLSTKLIVLKYFDEDLFLKSIEIHKVRLYV